MAETKKKAKEPVDAPKLGIIERDPWLEPYAPAIEGRYQRVLDKERELTRGKISLSEFATGHLYFGLHRTRKSWIFREWAPNAKEIYLIGDFNGWKELPQYKLRKVKGSHGSWEIELPLDAMKHEDLYKLKIRWNGGEGERIPAWARRVVQDEQTKIFSAQVWHPATPYKFHKKVFRAKVDPLMIYECHIGMAQNEEKVGSYVEFARRFFRALPPTDITVSRLWPSRSIPTTEASVITYRTSSLRPHASVHPRN